MLLIPLLGNNTALGWGWVALRLNSGRVSTVIADSSVDAAAPFTNWDTVVVSWGLCCSKIRLLENVDVVPST